jgi:hypothetical protein
MYVLSTSDPAGFRFIREFVRSIFRAAAEFAWPVAEQIPPGVVKVVVEASSVGVRPRDTFGLGIPSG